MFITKLYYIIKKSINPADEGHGINNQGTGMRHMIIEQLQVTLMAVFCYIIGDEKSGQAVVIDPAGDIGRIVSRLDELSLTVSAIVNTHGHADHTAGNSRLKNITGAPILIHKADVRMLSRLSNRVFARVLKGKKSPAPDRELQHMDNIYAGETELQVLHTPGHSPGSISLYAKGNLFTGDTLFTEGMGRTDIKGGSEKEIMQSIKSILNHFPDDTVIWPGHNYGKKPYTTVYDQKMIYGRFS